MEDETFTTSTSTSETSGLIPRHHHSRQKKGCRYSIEIPLFTYFFAASLSESVFSNLILYKTCTVTYGYNETICTSVVSSKNDNTTKELEELLQPKATNIVMIKLLVEGIFPAIISLFLGSWSDINGRKPLIISSMIGYFTYFCICIAYAQLSDIDPWYLILSTIPFSLLGGLSSLITGIFCFVSDVTKDSDRSFRMSVLEGAILFGILLGSIISPYVFKSVDYVGTFIICAIVVMIGLLYSIFVLSESVHDTTQGRYSSFINFQLLSDMIKTCFKQRLYNRRLIIFLVMLACSLSIFVLQGDGTVNYFFTREKLSWRLEEYTLYNAYSIVTTIIGIVIVTMIFQKYLKLTDGTISMIAYLSAALRSIVVACSTKSWHMYFGATISCLRGVSNAMNRAILTNVVPSEDAGKVLSLTTSLETIIPLISSPLYSYIYQKTLVSFPGAYNIITAIFYYLSFIFLCVVEYLMRIQSSFIPVN